MIYFFIHIQGQWLSHPRCHSALRLVPQNRGGLLALTRWPGRARSHLTSPLSANAISDADQHAAAARNNNCSFLSSHDSELPHHRLSVCHQPKRNSKCEFPLKDSIERESCQIQATVGIVGEPCEGLGVFLNTHLFLGPLGVDGGSGGRRWRAPSRVRFPRLRS